MSARLPLRWALARSPLTRIWPASCHLRGINRISLHILTCSPKCCFESTAHQKVTLNPWYPGRLYTTDACAQARGAVTLCNNPTLPSPNARLRRVRQRQHVLQRHLARQQHALAQHAHHEVAHLRALVGRLRLQRDQTRVSIAQQQHALAQDRRCEVAHLRWQRAGCDYARTKIGGVVLSVAAMQR